MPLKVKPVGKVFWITGFADPADDCGPYHVRSEAVEDLAGIERKLQFGHERRFWTTEKIPWSRPPAAVMTTPATAKPKAASLKPKKPQSKRALARR